MRRAAKVDANHDEVVRTLMAFGCSVQSLAPVGFGCPDLLVGWRGNNYLFEVKPLEGKRQPKAKRLNADQVRWHAGWAGSVCVVTSGAEALAAMGVRYRPEVRAVIEIAEVGNANS